MVTFTGYFYFMQLLCHCDSVYDSKLCITLHYYHIMLEARSKRGKGVTSTLRSQVIWLTLN